jgi:mono/diheme cytochrome c family protein
MARANTAGTILAVATMLAAGIVSGQSPAAGSVERGKDIFLKYTCYGCHGFSGQNGPGARLVPMMMSQANFTNYVRGPRTRQMPSYSTKVLSDEQLGEVYAYLKTLPKSPPAKDIAALGQFKQE